MHRLRNQLAPLRVLDAVHRTGSVTRAAERLHITPGAVIRACRGGADATRISDAGAGQRGAGTATGACRGQRRGLLPG